MFHESVSRGAENANNPCVRKKRLSKGLKQRANALNDVKNTIHSHASNFPEKPKKDDKKGKSVDNFKSVNTEEKSKLSIVLEDDKDESVVTMREPEFECINHFLCEKENGSYRAAFLDEYALTQRELEYLGNRMNFFSVNPVPFKVKTLPPDEDIELEVTDYRPVLDEGEKDDLWNIDVPEPPYF